MSTTYTTWASSAPTADVVAPSVTKQALGWVDNEHPPHETVNWYMNRTDTRLDALERPWVKDTLTIEASSSRAEYAVNSTLTVPAYTVGQGSLEVYLDGIRCTNGETYEEVGTSGTSSTTIKWLVKIGPDYRIYCESRTYPGMNVSSLNTYIDNVLVSRGLISAS